MPVTVTLTDAQAAHIAREVLNVSSLTMLAECHNPQRTRQLLTELGNDRRYSRSTLRALAVLDAFASDGSEREVKHVAEELNLSQSTTHRYINTWVILGELEQDAATRRYRRRSEAH